MGQEVIVFPAVTHWEVLFFSAILLSVVWKSSLKSRLKYVFYVLVSLFGFLIGLSRIYLHVHFASDVLGALLVAICWFFLLIFIYRLLFSKEEKKQAKKAYPGQADYLSGNYHLN